MKKLLLFLFPLLTTFSFAQNPKNTIVVIGAGMGYNHITVSEYFHNATPIYKQFPIQTGVYTLPAISQKITDQKEIENFNSHYHSDEAWSDYNWINSSSADYASAGTAIATGFPTGQGAVGVGIDSVELKSVLSTIKQEGKAFGIISNVPITQSTTIGFFAKTYSATDQDTILKQLLDAPIDLMLCTGHPNFDSLGNLLVVPQYNFWNDQQSWQKLINDTGLNFVSLSDSSLNSSIANKTFGIGTYQAKTNQSFLVSNAVPALKKLDKFNSGFTAVFESRQIEYASKAGNKEQLLKEMLEFNQTVDSIVTWIENNGGWEENALIVLGSYETGLIADTTFKKDGYFETSLYEISEFNEGESSFSFNSDGNTNVLTPLFAKGKGTELLKYYSDHSDYYRGDFVSLPEVGKLLFSLNKPTKPAAPKNIILMIGDGAGENHLKSAQYYFGYKAEYEDFPVKFYLSTYPGRNNVVKSIGRYLISYDSKRAWGDKKFLSGYNNVTCSASSALAMASGKKSYYYGMGLDLDFNSLNTIAQHAKNINKSAGVISTMTFYNATPAAFAAHNLSRTIYNEISREMLIESSLDVIIGAGHPEYTNNATLSDIPDYSDFGGKENWLAIKNNAVELPIASNAGWNTVQDTDGDGEPNPWTLVENTADFKLIDANTSITRLLGIPKVSETLQQKRDGDTESVNLTNKNDVPSLATLSQSGLSVLNKNPNGFFVMIEGGAIDQAAHKLQKGRLIEEVYDFQNAVDTVITWIENNGGWDKNLLIVTADHETGLLLRNELKDNSIWENYKIQDNGTGVLPTMEFNHKDHSNQLVPFYAKGAGSELFNEYADEFDFYRGRYLTNTEVGEAFHALWDGTPGFIKNLSVKIISSIDRQMGTVGEPFEFRIPNDIFSDIEDNTFNFSVTIPDGFSDWLTYDSLTKTLSGIPIESMTSSFTIRVFDGNSTGGATEVSCRIPFGISEATNTTSPITVSDNETESDLTTVYPNPSNSQTEIKVVCPNNATFLRINSVIGTVLYLKQNPPRDNIIDLSSFGVGQFVLTIESESGIETQTIIIE